MLFQPNVRLVQSPAYTLQIGANVEQSAGFGVKTAQNALLLHGYPQVCGQLTHCRSLIAPLRMILMIHSCSAAVAFSFTVRRIATTSALQCQLSTLRQLRFEVRSSQLVEYVVHVTYRQGALLYRRSRLDLMVCHAREVTACVFLCISIRHVNKAHLPIDRRFPVLETLGCVSVLVESQNLSVRSGEICFLQVVDRALPITLRSETTIRTCSLRRAAVDE